MITMEAIIIFYKYVAIPDVEGIKKWQQKLCQTLQLNGRIILAEEGINATVAGNKNLLDKYMQIMEKHPLFSGIDYKISQGSRNHFPRLSIKIKQEIVRLGIAPTTLTTANTGIHLTPKQVHELLENKSDDLLVLDTRNQYEWEIGHFQGAINPAINYFREFPEYIDKNLEHFKDKQVLMYCTAGVRCERATAYLKEKNVAKEVYQIKGGIHRYIEQYPEGFFRGKNYVFDGRISVESNADILSHCFTCKKPCNEYTNCDNTRCNRHYISCQSCKNALNRFCSKECLNIVKQFPHYLQKEKQEQKTTGI